MTTTRILAAKKSYWSTLPKLLVTWELKDMKLSVIGDWMLGPNEIAPRMLAAKAAAKDKEGEGTHFEKVCRPLHLVLEPQNAVVHVKHGHLEGNESGKLQNILEPIDLFGLLGAD